MSETATDSRSAAIRNALERGGKGLCIGCGVAMETGGKWPRCPVCAKRHWDAMVASGAIARRSARQRAKNIAAGRCASLYCKEIPAAGRRMCERHLRLNAEAVKRYLLRRAANVATAP